MMLTVSQLLACRHRRCCCHTRYTLGGMTSPVNADAAAAAAAAATSSFSSAQQFIGTYQLVQWRQWQPGQPDTEWFPLGVDAVGILQYAPTGLVSVQMTRRQRAAFSDEVDRWGRPLSAPDSLARDSSDSSTFAVAQAFAEYSAYFGRFEVDSERRLVYHYVDGSLYPNRVGTRLERTYDFTSATTLVLSTPDSCLTWERMPTIM
jgi:hypothetical protein